MYACVYCSKDKSISVLGQKSKKLQLLGTFQVNERVNMTWSGVIYPGIIVRIGEDEEKLTEFATLANKKILKKFTDESIVVEKLVNFIEGHQTIPTKRTLKETSRLTESKKQEGEFVPKKKKIEMRKDMKEISKSTEKNDKKKKTIAKEVKRQNEQSAQSQKNQQKKTQEMVQKKIFLGNLMLDQFKKKEVIGNDDKNTPKITNKDTNTDAEIDISETSLLITNKDASSSPMTDSHDTPETIQVNRSTTPATNSDPHEIPETIQVIKSTSPGTNTDAQGIPDKIIVTKSTSSATNTNTHVIPETSLVINKGTLSTTNTETHDNSITRSIITGAGGTSHSTHSAISTGNIGTATEASGYCPARQLTYKEADTSLTSTWSLCTGNRLPPNPPAEVLGMLRTLMKPSVQNYLAAFLDFYDSPDTEQSLEWPENMSYTDMLTSAETPQQAVPFLQHTPQNQGATYEAVKLPNSTPSHPFMQPLQCPSTIQAEVLSPPQEQLRRSRKQPQELAQGSSDDFGVLVYDEVEPLTSTPRRPLKQPSTDDSGTPTVIKVQSPPQGQLRRSPRKQSQEQAEESSDDVGRVRLLIKYDVKVNAKTLKQATKAALGLPNSKATFKLTAKVLTELFTPEELAASRGQGLRQKKETDFRPALDSHRLQILKEYVTAWCRKNNKGDPKEKDINDSITEQISYARKKIRTLSKQQN